MPRTWNDKAKTDTRHNEHIQSNLLEYLKVGFSSNLSFFRNAFPKPETLSLLCTRLEPEPMDDE